jgi:hypothetical protein
MAPRVNSELLLVGSLPADSADQALRAAAGFFGNLAFALPDGETVPGRPGSATSGPRYLLRSEDRSFFRPLADLEPGDARVFLGIVLPIDGVPGYGAGTPRPRVTSPTSAWRCTAGSAASQARRGRRPCGSTPGWSARSGKRARRA